MISMTVFETIFDNKTNMVVNFSDFNKFTKSLEYLSTKKGYKPKKGEHIKGSPLISPAIYHKNSTRSNSNVIEWGGFAMLDVDNHDFSENIEYDLSTTYPNIHFVCYSTASSTKNHPKFRLVFPLSRRINNQEIPHFWYALNTHFCQIGDGQTKDCSRMFYIPGQYPDAYNFFFVHNGNELNVDQLIEDYPWSQPDTNDYLSRLDPKIKDKIINARARKLEDKSKKIIWTDYNDCPFVPKHLINEYKSIAFIDGTGRYHFIYKLMVLIAINAIKSNYAITEYEIVELIHQLDKDTAQLYNNRKLIKEAHRALTWGYTNT